MESTTSAESTDGMLSINSSTAVLTDTSGYHLNATVTNTTGQEIPAGTLTLAMNAFYTFVSRNDIQDWSEGNGRIPTPQSVGQADVPALQPGASANVSIDADAIRNRSRPSTLGAEAGAAELFPPTEPPLLNRIRS